MRGVRSLMSSQSHRSIQLSAGSGDLDNINFGAGFHCKEVTEISKVSFNSSVVPNGRSVTGEHPSSCYLSR
jgi:hypothetical protein